MVRQKIVVVGYYGKGNLGDETFRVAIEKLWPCTDFRFLEFADVKESDLSGANGVWFGAGDICEKPLRLHVPENIPVAFLGVGLGSAHSSWDSLFSRAKFVVTRDHRWHSKLAQERLPDLCFALKAPACESPETGDYRRANVLVLLNAGMIPVHTDAQWKGRALDWFNHEFAEFADKLCEKEIEVTFASMQVSPHVDDSMASSGVISQMTHRTGVRWDHYPLTREALFRLIYGASCVISSKLHGCVFAAQAGKPFLALNCHDKVRAFADEFETMKWTNNAEYFGARKSELLEKFGKVKHYSGERFLSYSERAYEKWEKFAAIAMAKFFG